MTPEFTRRLSTPDLLRIIESAKKAEFSRNLDLLQENLQSVWDQFDDNSIRDDFEPSIKAELLRLYGFFLTFHGRARNLREFQERAKNAITRAIKIFQNEKLDDKTAEANITLAFCYWNSGEVGEAEALLNLVENDFVHNRLHPVYLQLQINRLLLLCWDEKFERSLQIAEMLEPLMPFCTDLRLKTMFHFENAILMHRLNRVNEAIFHFQESISLAKKDENEFLLALTFNNFSLLYLDMRSFEDAHYFNGESLKILKRMNHAGWIAHILDSKALIYLEEDHDRKALAYAEEALHFFYQGEDHKGLVAALWTKIRCLLKVERIQDASIIFAELYGIAKLQISESVASRYAEKFSKNFYAVKQLPLLDEVSSFKKAQIKKALIETDCRVSAAAKKLRLKNHQTLSDILDRQFPELYRELNFIRKARRKQNDKTKVDAEIKTVSVKKKSFGSEKKIECVELPRKNYTFDFDFDFDEQTFKTYYFDKFQMSENFGINEGAVIASSSVNVLSKDLTGRFIIVVDREKNIITGRLDHDEFLDVYFLSIPNEEPLPIDESHLIKKVVGFCPLDETDQSFIRFSKI